MATPNYTAADYRKMAKQKTFNSGPTLVQNTTLPVAYNTSRSNSNGVQSGVMSDGSKFQTLTPAYNNNTSSAISKYQSLINAQRNASNPSISTGTSTATPKTPTVSTTPTVNTSASGTTPLMDRGNNRTESLLRTYNQSTPSGDDDVQGNINKNNVSFFNDLRSIRENNANRGAFNEGLARAENLSLATNYQRVLDLLNAANNVGQSTGAQNTNQATNASKLNVYLQILKALGF